MGDNCIYSLDQTVDDSGFYFDITVTTEKRLNFDIQEKHEHIDITLEYEQIEKLHKALVEWLENAQQIIR